MSPAVVVVIILILLALVAVGVVLARRRRSTQLQQQFGPEYERSVTAASGDRKAAEAVLSERQQRRQEFDVRDLRPEERSRFRDSWAEIQREFVDDPRRSLHSADLLVAEVMRTRGYPVDDDFDRRADDLSVDHPRVVQHYREARSVRDGGGEVDTENQRTAIRSYRSLIDALLGDEDADRGDGRADTREPEHVRSGDVADRAATDGRVTDADLRDPDGAAGGRHALRDTEARDDVPRADVPRDVPRGDVPRRDTTDPTDPNGPQGPRTEERTR